ncbi:MAG TPA: hypothetical protein VHL78_02655, partial [Actinomycetota bacterium]|nr:hypothetical protein [Actinomycetota bacterium]
MRAPLAGADAATFSPRLASRLTVVGGTLAVLGALGTWIRATEVPTEGAMPQEVARVVGVTEPVGLGLAALAAAGVGGG